MCIRDSRYFCLMALAIYAVKCGITDRKRVKADMDSLVPFLSLIHICAAERRQALVEGVLP